MVRNSYQYTLAWSNARSDVAFRAAGKPDVRPERVVPRAGRVAWAFVAAVALFLIWSRFTHLNSGLWNDEAYTAMNFIDRGPVTMFSGYYDPNNHLLFSLLTWATTNIVGQSEAVYRMWSVVPGVVAVGIVGWWAQRRLRPLAGASVIVLATMSSVHLVLAPRAVTASAFLRAQACSSRPHGSATAAGAALALSGPSRRWASGPCRSSRWASSRMPAFSSSSAATCNAGSSSRAAS